MKNLVVIPAYNEEAALPSTMEMLQSLTGDFELLVVNDGSTDRTGDVAEALAKGSGLAMHVVHLPTNCGIGAAVQTGYIFAVQRGQYRYVVQFDADGQHDAGAILQLVEACERDGLDLCVGSRFLDAADDGYRSSSVRRLGIRFFSGLISVLSRTRVTDPTSGLRCAGPRLWPRFAARYPDDYPEPESLYWCARNKMRIGEIPVRMFPRDRGRSSIRRLDSIYYMIKVTISILVESLRKKEYFQ